MSDIDIDVVDGLGTDTYVAEAQTLYPNAIRASSVGQMVIAIMNRLGENRLRRLSILGHGRPGWQGVADSQSTIDTDRVIAVDSAGNLINPTILALLAASFGPDGYVELHGCNVAADQQGKELLDQLSRIWRVPVSAGIKLQYAPAGFEGPSRTAHALVYTAGPHYKFLEDLIEAP